MFLCDSFLSERNVPAPRPAAGADRGGAPCVRAKNSDGKPCSGVRGDQRVSTALPCRMGRDLHVNLRGENAV